MSGVVVPIPTYPLFLMVMRSNAAVPVAIAGAVKKERRVGISSVDGAESTVARIAAPCWKPEPSYA